MDATVKGDLSSYRSPRRVLADWFRKSRDRWKQKYMDVKAEIKRFKNRAYDLQKSRDHWKEEAAAHQQQIEALQVEVEQLKAQLMETETGQGSKKKTGPDTTTSLALRVPGSPPVASTPDRPLARQSFSLGSVEFFCQLVLRAGTSLQAASRVMPLASELFSLSLESPHATTGRLWLLRLGYYKLHRPKTAADDWIWLVDHVVQIGLEKCLVIVGVRLCQLPPPGTPLRLEDLEPIAVLPVTKSNQEVVHQQLEENALKTGTPRAILGDHGSDLLAGVNRFCGVHPETSSLYDIVHKAARVLKVRLERDGRWKEFCTQVGQTKFQTQQTELAFLVPPSQRSKARYMNLGPLLKWAYKTLEVLQQRPAEVMAYCSEARLEEKFGWLREYREALSEWNEYQTIVDAAVESIRKRGYGEGAAEELAARLQPLVRSAWGEALQEELVSFVAVESRAAQPGERLPGSTEILESSFGKWKSLEGDNQRGGFTSLILGYAALLSTTTQDVIAKAIETTPTKLVQRWCRDHLGKTVRGKRIAAFQAVTPSAEAQENRDEPGP